MTNMQEKTALFSFDGNQKHIIFLSDNQAKLKLTCDGFWNILAARSACVLHRSSYPRAET